MYCAQVLGWRGDERGLVLPCVCFENGDGYLRLSHSLEGLGSPVLEFLVRVWFPIPEFVRVK
jgi:hypothetical protein